MLDSIQDRTPDVASTGRFTLRFVAMAPDEALLDLAREFSASGRRATRATVERLGALGTYRARVAYSVHEADFEAENAFAALRQAFDALRAMVAGTATGPRRLASESLE